MTSGTTRQKKKKQPKKHTHFAPVERASNDDLQCDIRSLSHSPFVDGIMHATGGLLAILNEQRQILALNEVFVQSLGIEDVASVFGLRLGETLTCVHAHDETGGCGTSRHCATCGAVIAMMATLNSNSPQQRECVVTVKKDGKPVDFCFLVNCSPIQVDGVRYLLLLLQDITISQNRAALEKMFFHDVENMIGALTLNTRLMSSLPGEQDRQASQQRIQQIASYLAKEVEMQHLLVRDEAQSYCLEFSETTVRQIVDEIRDMVTHHPAASGKQLNLNESVGNTRITTDLSLLRRVLTNMLINAFEATRPGHSVKLSVSEHEESILFDVWNEIPIPDSIALRVFQRNFSTKSGSGRGLGTYTMKLFGENYLKGTVSFNSSPTTGTVFRFALPKHVH